MIAKHRAGKQVGELNPIPGGYQPFAIVHLDHLGPFVTSTRGNVYILAAICRLTKFRQLYAVRNTKAATTVRKIDDFVNRFGAPKRFINDRGTCFTSDTFKDFCKRHGIKITFNSTKHAQANGQVERLNQTNLPALQTSLTDFEGRHWDDGLIKLERDLNISECKTTGKTPFESLYGYIPRYEAGYAVCEPVKSVKYERKARDSEEGIVSVNPSNNDVRRSTRLRNQPNRYTNV